MNEQTVNEQTVDQNLNPCPTPRKSRKVRLGVLGAALGVSLALGAVAVNQLVPKASNRLPGFSARLGWYVAQGQLQADIHTLAAAIHYIAASDNSTGTRTDGASQPVAGATTASSPKT